MLKMVFLFRWILKKFVWTSIEFQKVDIIFLSQKIVRISDKNAKSNTKLTRRKKEERKWVKNKERNEKKTIRYGLWIWLECLCRLWFSLCCNNCDASTQLIWIRVSWRLLIPLESSVFVSFSLFVRWLHVYTSKKKTTNSLFWFIHIFPHFSWLFSRMSVFV